MKVATLAVVRVKDGQGPAFEAMFRTAKALVMAHEPGALVYDLTRSREDANLYKVMEIYQDAEAFKAHGKVEGFGAIFASLPSLVDGEPALEHLDVID